MASLEGKLSKNDRKLNPLDIQESRLAPALRSYIQLFDEIHEDLKDVQKILQVKNLKSKTKQDLFKTSKWTLKIIQDYEDFMRDEKLEISNLPSTLKYPKPIFESKHVQTDEIVGEVVKFNRDIYQKAKDVLKERLKFRYANKYKPSLPFPCDFLGRTKSQKSIKLNLGDAFINDGPWENLVDDLLNQLRMILYEIENGPSAPAPNNSLPLASLEDEPTQSEDIEILRIASLESLAGAKDETLSLVNILSTEAEQDEEINHTKVINSLEIIEIEEAVEVENPQSLVSIPLTDKTSSNLVMLFPDKSKNLENAQENEFRDSVDFDSSKCLKKSSKEESSSRSEQANQFHSTNSPSKLPDLNGNSYPEDNKSNISFLKYARNMDEDNKSHISFLKYARNMDDSVNSNGSENTTNKTWISSRKNQNVQDIDETSFIENSNGPKKSKSNVKFPAIKHTPFVEKTYQNDSYQNDICEDKQTNVEIAELQDKCQTKPKRKIVQKHESF